MGNFCPDCHRPKAHNWSEVKDGFCPKWHAIRDEAAEQDCVRAKAELVGMLADQQKAVLGSSRALRADDFIFKTSLNGCDIEMDALSAEELCLKMEAFGDDCADGCKRMRASIREAINRCTDNEGVSHEKGS